MNKNAAEFPPNAQEIKKCLEVYTDFIYEKLDVWTCDQAAQVVSGIDPHGFNQNDADNFIALIKILNSCAIANTISPIEKTDGKIYLKPHDVIKWAIDNEYKLSIYILDWYTEQGAKLNEVILTKKWEPSKIIQNNKHSNELSASKLNKQQAAILDAINNKGFNPMEIPDGDKGTIKSICELENKDDLFKAATAFDTAWKKGINKLWRMKHYESYAHRGNN